MKPQDALKKSIDDLMNARKALVKLEELQAQHDKAREELVNEILELEENRGSVVLDAAISGNGSEVGRQVSKAILEKRIELETMEDVLHSLIPRLEDARRTIVEATANCFRAEADVVDRQADTRQVKTDELLQALAEWEKCDYIPKPAPPMQAIGNQVVGTLNVVFIPTPLTGSLRRQAAFYRECSGRVLAGKPIPTNFATGTPLYPLPSWFDM